MVVGIVSENFTLDEFDASGTDAEATLEVEPLEPVQRWRPTAATCPRCGASINEQWEDGGISGVCTGCKDW